MRVLVVGRPSALASYQAKWNYLPNDIELTLITPPYINQVLGGYEAEPSKRWPHLFVPAWLSERMSPFGFNPFSLWQAIKQVNPELVHVDEEPPSLALLELTLLKKWFRYRLIFVTWENLITTFLPPFQLVRRLNLTMADAAIAGNSEAENLLRQSGFNKPVAVIPLTATDIERFVPIEVETLRHQLGLTTFTVGYIGRLVAEKGVGTLLQALAKLSGDWQGLIIGRGPHQAILKQQSQMMGIASRIKWVDTVPYHDIPKYINAMDVMVLPSLTASRWKEQFGRVLAEAMACEVAVIGSDSGSIPEVIGDAGLIFPEGDAVTLSSHLANLYKNPLLRQSFGKLGRQRVLAHFTNQQIATRTLTFWHEIYAHNKKPHHENCA